MSCSSCLTLTHQYLSLELTLSFACIFSLKPLDVEFMKQLHDKVNIVPVIGKADTLTPTELQSMKRRVIIKKNYFQCYVLIIRLFKNTYCRMPNAIHF